ncbi:TetR/AcrR family transcriptional regulator [Streptomyces flaveus]|nr:TetR/AcrR family transcriptional regulator [Streptomyces flaveus]
MSTVHRATLDALAQYGPRRAGMTQIARLAGTNRPYLYRNWASREALVREATRLELKHLLYLARETVDPLPPRCLAVRFVVRAARLVREHPVVRTMARTDPDLVHASILRPATDWHSLAWAWLCDYVTGHLAAGAERDSTTLAVLTTAIPYALTPPADSSTPEDRAAIDARLSTAVHLCLGASLPCTDCGPTDSASRATVTGGAACSRVKPGMPPFNSRARTATTRCSTFLGPHPASGCSDCSHKAERSPYTLGYAE